MKVLLLFIFYFLLMSVLPLLWNNFSIDELGFPFQYCEKTSFESVNGTGLKASFLPINLLYNLIIISILCGVSIYLERYFKMKRSL